MGVNLYLMSAKGLAALKAVVSSRFKGIINEVCIGRDPNVSNDYAQDICNLCETSGINWKYRDKEIKMITSEYSIAISWRWILKDIPNLIVIHDSLLPKYRGFSPLVSQLINGESEIGVSAIWAEREYDTGDVIYQASTSITYPIKIAAAIEQISQCYIDSLLYILQKLAEDSFLPSMPQDHSEATYSLWRDAQDYWINWNDTSERIARFIDAVGMPYDGATSLCNGDKIVIREACPVPDLTIENRCPGKIVHLHDGLPIVVCGSGLLMIKDAIYEESGSPLLPLNSFRSRFS